MTRHLRFAILTLLVATLPAVTALADLTADTTPDGGPKAVVDQPIVDKGAVPVGKALEAEFTVRNEGTETLEILRVNPACGCTVAEYDEHIPPGGSGTVHATVDTKNMAGPIAKTVMVYTNDPGQPQIQLTIKSEVKPFLAARPGYARFTSLVHGDQDHRSNQLVWGDDFTNLEVLGVESPKPWIEVTYHEAGEGEREEDVDGRQWVIDIRVDKSAPVGPIADYVVVKTNHPEQKELQIPISGFVRPMVAVTPPDVRFGDVDPSKGQSWGVLVRNFGSTPLEIGSYESTVPGLEVEVEPIKAGQQYKVTLTPTSKMAEGAFSGRVEIETNLPEDKTIAIDLAGNVVATSAGN